MPPQIDVAGEIELAEELREVLQELFAGYQRVVIKREFSGNLSGSRVLLVRPIHAGGAEIPAVVKLAATSLIQKEIHAFDRMRNMLYSIVDVRDSHVPESGSWGALRYVLHGGGLFEVESLHSYYDEHAIDEVLYLVAQLFTLVNQVYQQSDFAPEVPWRAGYDRVMPVNLLVAPGTPPAEATLHVVAAASLPAQTLQQREWVRLEGFAVTKVDVRKGTVTLDRPNASAVGAPSYVVRLKYSGEIPAYAEGEVVPEVTGQIRETRTSQLERFAREALGKGHRAGARSIPSPGLDLPELPNPLLGALDLLKDYQDVRIALIHGDLNLENIMIDTERKHVGIIDLAEARKDHILHDFLRLETEVMTKLVPQTLHAHRLSPITETFNLYHYLHANVPGACAPSGAATAPDPALNRELALLQNIREAARRYLSDDRKMDEYYQGLLLYLVGALKFGNLARAPTAPLPKQVAFWSAAAIQQILTPLVPKEAAVPGTGAQKSHALLLSFVPEVKVRRSGSNFLMDPQVGMALTPEDVVSTYAGAEAQFFCDEGSLIVVSPNRNHQADCRDPAPDLPLNFPLPDKKALIAQSFASAIAHREDDRPALFESPRNTHVATSRPDFRWRPVAGAKRYRLTLRMPGGRAWEQETQETALPFPGDLPPLEPGSCHTAIVEAIGAPFPEEFTRETVRFCVLDERGHADLQRSEEAVYSVTEDPTARRVLLAQLYQAHRLWTEAIAALEGVFRFEENVAPELRIQLGALYLRTGDYTRADERCAEILALPPDEVDVETRALARMGRACVRYVQGDLPGALEQLAAAGEGACAGEARSLRDRLQRATQSAALHQGPIRLSDYVRHVAERIAPEQIREEMSRISGELIERLQALDTFNLQPNWGPVRSLGLERADAMEILTAAFVTTERLVEQLSPQMLAVGVKGPSAAHAIRRAARETAEALGMSPEAARDFAERYAELVEADLDTFRALLSDKASRSS